jgi:hypothetical protein
MRTDLTPTPAPRVHPMRYRCDRCQHSVEIETTTPHKLPAGWSVRHVTGDNYSEWREDWCPKCTRVLEDRAKARIK